ncbi:energy transducer TonB [Dyella flagellata]|uniref:Cell envelope biogenesis protein TonB n=1 Tax=Dyella flagellata TaxID=1867833 RepID=A0ABQ5XHF9_9GAMM|nr:energy transducer TonB [Dyella flagellata]GLQ90631.1 cell envelope biogenesis protein TonB [Dyella flagellata]
MSSASLAVVRHAQHPDMARIAALSAAIAFNLAALVFALRPLAPQFAQVLESPKATIVRVIEPPPPQPPPPVLKVQPLPIAVPHVPIVHEPPKSPPIADPPTTEPSNNVVPVAPTPVAPPTSIVPGVVSLAYRASPLRFPTQALRMHMQGTVMLRVLVDETGKPIDVVIEHSSGSALLDKSAREQVLASWLFQPAVMDGHAVKAWARVPVSFVMQQM